MGDGRTIKKAEPARQSERERMTAALARQSERE